MTTIYQALLGAQSRMLNEEVDMVFPLLDPTRPVTREKQWKDQDSLRDERSVHKQPLAYLTILNFILKYNVKTLLHFRQRSNMIWFIFSEDQTGYGGRRDYKRP